MRVIDTSGLSREQWLALRRQSIGASDAPVICGLSSYKTRFQLWLEKTGQMEPEPAGEQARWGLRLEDDISAELSGHYNVEIAAEQVMIQSEEYDWLTATLDMVTTDNQIYQYKCAGFNKAAELVAEVASTLPPDWVIQSHHEMIASGNRFINYAVFIGHRLVMWPFLLPWDQAVGDALLPLLIDFRQHVEDRTPPTDFQPGDADVLKRLYRGKKAAPIISTDAKLLERARQYESAKESAKFQAELADQMEAWLLASMGEATKLSVGPYEFSRIDCEKKPEKEPRKGYRYTQFRMKNINKPSREE
jgi:putative phage-type endonuclease